MGKSTDGKRMALFREAAVFQLKLAADGFRDLILVPVSLIAALVGLMRGGGYPEKEFRDVIELGRRTERWINLFGTHEPETGKEPTLDQLLERAETVVRDQANKGGITENATHAIERALDAVQRAAAKAPTPAEPGENARKVERAEPDRESV
ncbi:MAG: hypothetical protein ACO3KY_10430 [Lysobacterales bacterium]